MDKKVLYDLFSAFEVPGIFHGEHREGPVVISEQIPEGAFVTCPDPVNDMSLTVLQDLLNPWISKSYEIEMNLLADIARI